MGRAEAEMPVQKLKDFEPGPTQAFYGLVTQRHSGFYLTGGDAHVDPETIGLYVPGWIAFIGRSTGIVTVRDGRSLDLTQRGVESVLIDGDWGERTGRIVFSGKSTVELKHDRRSNGIHTYVLTKTDNDGVASYEIDGRI